VENGYGDIEIFFDVCLERIEVREENEQMGMEVKVLHL
jgi:hypothetical protein